MNSIIENNVNLMLSDSSGGMQCLLKTESIGGNAATWQGSSRRYSCYSANYYYTAETGEIKYFGNSQHVPSDIRKNFQQGCLRLAVTLIDYRGLKDWIVENFASPTTDAARVNLEESISIYNETVGYKTR